MQAAFEPKPVEALYNVEQDFYETKNLATDPQYKKELLSLRKELQDTLQSLPDLGFYPEPYLVNQATESPIQFGQQHKQDLLLLSQIADLQLLSFEQAQAKMVKALTSENDWQRYWGLNVALSFKRSTLTC
ncbi:hypothetical protein RS130_09910 [Paraglaciecola aquimarina]|uniref:Uncharacterized protein n=1 Tax=Paraglaciecola aquimarina TaxID=1235557 RepID=A0ABU3SWB7_9ALTE|nr:hypothetical protein [Paraglaciecola aquimarina]MDU0354207.1 hypothetical protein [Paraglaciecola aquimarina]